MVGFILFLFLFFLNLHFRQVVIVMVRVVLYRWSKLGIKVWPGHERRPGRRRG